MVQAVSKEDGVQVSATGEAGTLMLEIEYLATSIIQTVSESTGMDAHVIRKKLNKEIKENLNKGEN
jgi:hypothetical protein